MSKRDEWERAERAAWPLFCSAFLTHPQVTYEAASKWADAVLVIWRKKFPMPEAEPEPIAPGSRFTPGPPPFVMSPQQIEAAFGGRGPERQIEIKNEDWVQAKVRIPGFGDMTIADISAQLNTLATIQGSVAEMANERDALASQLIAVRADRDATIATAESHRAEAGRYYRRCEELLEQRESWKDRATDLEAMLADVRATGDAAVVERDALRGQLTAANERTETYAKRCDTLQTQFKDLKAQIRALGGES